MADVTKLPLNLHQQLSSKPTASRLPLSLARKLGSVDADIVTPSKKRRMQWVAAETSFTLTHSMQVTQADDRQTQGKAVLSAFDSTSVRLSLVHSDYDMSVLNFYHVANDSLITTIKPLLLHASHKINYSKLLLKDNCYHQSLSKSVGFIAFTHTKTSKKQFLNNHNSSKVSQAINHTSKYGHLAASQLIDNTSTHNVQQAVGVPCRHYPLPATTPDKPISFCQPRPPSDRLSLSLRRKRGQHSSARLPLALTCWHDIPAATVPSLRSYIMHNTISATVAGISINPLSFRVRADIDGFCWSGDIDITQSDYQKIAHKLNTERGKEALISVNINEMTFVLLAEEQSKSREFLQSSYRLSGRSVTARLSVDYAKAQGGGLLDNALYASQIAQMQITNTGVKLEYLATDWLIAANIYSVAAKTPMGVIGELAEACGGFIYSDTSEAKLSIKPRFKKPAWELSAASPDVILSLDAVRRISEQRRVNTRYNTVFLSSNSRLDKVYRATQAADSEAPAVANELFTTQECTINKGIEILSKSGTHIDYSILTYCNRKYGLSLAKLGDIWQVNDEDGAWNGVVVSVELSVELQNDVPVVLQTVSIDRYADG